MRARARKKRRPGSGFSCCRSFNPGLQG
jgi:hypothetical protein